MRIKNYFYFLFLFLGFISCLNKDKNKNTIEVNPKIIHIQNTYYYDYYLFDSFQDNENNIKIIFNFIKKTSNSCIILIDKNDVYFDDGVPFHNKKIYQRFSFFRESFKNKGITVNFLENKPIHFKIEEKKQQKELFADFETLMVNTVQNFLDYAEKDEAKKEQETYTYILDNKNKIEKIKLVYHEYGKWFEVEIL
jgi:hypothetical protein